MGYEMSVQIQRAPGTVDVTRKNPKGVAYLIGDEFTDGSVRLESEDPLEEFPHFELRVNGIWKNTGLTLSPNTLFLGEDVSISGLGSHLQVNSVESNRKSLLLEASFDDAGTELPHAHIVGPLQVRVVFSPNIIGEIVTSLFELPVSSFVTAFRYKYYFKTGSVAATASVRMTLSKGSTPGGVVVFTLEMPASQWSANTEVEVVLEGALTLTIGAPLLLTIESDNNFSLIGDFANGGNFFAMDFQSFELEDVITVPLGTERFLVSNAARMMINNNGHPIFSGRQGSLSTATPAAAFPPSNDPPA